MSIITGFDNTDSALNIPKFYLGKITGQENIGARDSEGNPVPYYSSGDIGTLQSSVILQEFNKDEFKAPETAPNTDWINFLNPANPSDTTKTKRYSSFGFNKEVTWTIGLSDRDTEINYVTAVLSHWDDFIVKFGGIDYYFKDVYFVPVRQDLYIASDNFQTILKTPDDLFNALNNIKDSTSYLTIPVSNDARFFNEIVVDGEHNLYNFSNQLVAKNYLAAQDLYNNKSFFSFDAIYNVLESIRSKGDLMFGNGALRDLSVLNLFQQNTPYENITSGTIGNFNLITGLNLTGIKGFPTGYISGQYLQANETGLEFVPIDDPVFDFTGLTDTPSNITSVKFVRGNQAGDGLEFTGVKFLEDVDDRPSTPITSGYLQLTDQNTLVWNPVAPGGGDVTYNFTGSEYFTGLKDTPSGYELNKFLRSTHVGIEYADINDGLVSFTGLTDTPSSFAADKFLKINNAANAVEYVDIPSPSVDFTGLNDTPASYVNSSGKYLRINNAENSVEFIDISGEISSQEISWNSYLRRGDLPNASDHPGMFAYVSIDELGGNSGSAYIAHGNDWVQIFPTVPNFSFSGLVDTPASYIGSSGKFVKVSDDESGVEYANLPDPIVDFTGLTDTPSSFAGQSGKYLQVNAAENSIEFVNPLFSTGSFVGFGGATVLIGLETAQPQQGWNDRQITQLQGHSGIKNLSLSNNEITLPAGKYLINAEGGVFRSKQTRIGIEFTAGDYAGQRFESRSNYAGSIVGNDQGGARGSVKTAVQSQNQMTFKVVSFVGESQSATTFDYAQTDVTVLDLGGDRDVLSITGLFDTPTSYVGGSGKFLQVNDVEDGVQYSSLSGQISSQEIDWLVYSTISDLPSASEHHGMFAHVHSEGAAYMAHAGNWEKIYPVNASSLTFTGLSDTPNVYDNGKILQSTANGLEWVDLPAGGGGGNGEFSKANFTSTSYLRHTQYNKLSVDTNSFYTGSQDWSYNSTSNGVIGLRPPEDGYYDIFGSISDDRSQITDWTTTTQQKARIKKQNITNGTITTITEKGNAKYQTLNGPLTVDFQETNVYLTTDEYIYTEGYIYNNSRASTNFRISPYSYLSLAKAGGGGGGDAGTSTGGRGNLDVLKNNLENFQHTLPDSIVVPWVSQGYEATFYLFAVRPASASTPPTANSNWDIYYTCGRGHTDGELMFTDDADGTLVQANADIDQTPGGDFEAGTLTLKWLIDNDRAFYAGGTSDSGGGGSGGIGDSAEVISSSNFGSKIPDVILLHVNGKSDQPRSYYFFGIDNDPTDNVILYRSNANQQVSFVNNSAGDYDATLTNATHVRYAGDTTLQSIIDNGHAIYLGGGSSSGGGSSTDGAAEDNSYLKSFIETFTGKLPDAIIVQDDNPRIYDLRSVITTTTPHIIQYFNGQETSNSNKQFSFNDDDSGSLNAGLTITNHILHPDDSNLQDIINNGRALYFGGGGGGSSTFSASSYQENILQDHISTDNDANLNDLHFTGLETGAYYKLGGQVRFVAGFDNAGTNMWLYAYQDSFATDNIVAALNNRAGGEADPVNATHTFNHIFQATGDLFFAAGGMNSSQDRYIYGDGSKFQTFVQLEKLGSSSNGDGGGGGSNILAQGTYYAGIAELRNGLNISSVTKTSVGTFDIVFDIPIPNREYNVLATPIGTSLINVYVSSNNEDGFEIVTRHNDSHARTDASFDFVVFGVSGAGGGGSSTFAGLTDTPSTLTEGSGQYLKVSDDGQTIEYVDLPAGSIGGSSSGGGINSNPAISALSNFTGILPDSILLNNNNGSHTTFDIYSIDTDDIQYRSTYDNHQRVTFDNDSSGAFDLSLSITNNYPWISGQPNCLQDMIDDGLAIFAGGGAGGAGGGGGGSTILPSGSILQKAFKEGAGISSTTLNQEIISIDFTPKASDSILECEISFHWGDGGSNSLQQGSFFVDGVQVPGDIWYKNIQTPNSNARINTHHKLYLAAENTNSRTISNKITLQQNGASAIGAPKISVAEIAQSDFTLTGGGTGGGGGSSTFADLTDTPSTLTEGSGQYLKVSDDGQTIEYVDLPAGSAGSGGIGDSAEVINLSNFSGKIPDIIQFAASQGPVSYQFRYIQSNNLQFYDVGGNGERFRFNNDASGTFLDTNSSYSRYAGDTTLQSIIDNGHAIYLGGGGGGGGGGSSDNAIIQQGTYTGNSTANNAEQTINLGFTPVRVEIFGRNDFKPHAIMLKDKPDTYYSWRAIDGTHDEHRTSLLTSIIIQDGFKVANGANANASQLNWDGEEFDYYATADAGGGGGSSTFADLTDTPSTLTEGSGQYLKVSDDGQTIEYVDLPADGGIDSIDDVTDLPDNPADGQLITVGCDLYIGCNGEWVKVGANAVAPPSEAPACVSNLEEYNQYTEYKDQFLADNSNASFSAGLNNQTNIHDFIHDVCLFADSNLSQERNTVVIDETTYKWGMFASNQNINIRAQAFSDSNVGSCTFKEWRSNLPNFPKTNAQETIFIDQDASITGCFECTVVPSQPNCNQVALHLQPDTGETIADKSDNQHTVTTVGDVVVDTTAMLFGGGTMNFDGNGDYLTISDGFINLTQDFTIEFWYNPDSFDFDTATSTLFAFEHIQGDVSTTNNHLVDARYTIDINRIRVQSSSLSTTDVNTQMLTANHVPVLGQWVHVVWVKKSGVHTIYHNGVKDISWQEVIQNSSVSGQLNIGALTPNSGKYNGQIQDFRISKKVVYTNNFIPPTNLLANLCPDQPNCNQVALHLQPDTGETIADKSDNQHTVTTVGDIVVDTTAMLFGGGTMNFDVNSELTISSISNDFMSDTKDFTIEMWVQFKSGIVDLLVHQHPTRNRSYAILMYRGDRTETIDGYGGANRWFQFLVNHGQGSTSASNVWLVFMNFESPVEIQVDTWYHLALVRSNTSTWNLYVNGQPCRISPRWTDGGTYGDTAGSIIEYDGSMGLLANVNSSLAGHMQDIRISKKAVYTASFTPPTNLLANPCPDQPNCNQVALHLQPDAGETITDKSDNQHTVTTVGDVVVDTTAMLFGGGTMNFDGNEDYLRLQPGEYLNFDKDGDFTIECWFYLREYGYGGYTSLLGTSPVSNWTFSQVYNNVYSTTNPRYNGMSLVITNGNPVQIDFSVSNLLNGNSDHPGDMNISSNANIQLNTWYHVAMVYHKDQHTFKLYLNGQLIGQDDWASDRQLQIHDHYFDIGGRKLWTGHPAAAWNSSPDGKSLNTFGFIQDFRISKKAVYTNNFTPPTNLLANPC